MKIGDLYMTIETYNKMANPVGTIGKVIDLDVDDAGNFLVDFGTRYKDLEFEPDNIAYFGYSYMDHPKIERIAPLSPALEIMYGVN